jgi:hypothetical protein
MHTAQQAANSALGPSLSRKFPYCQGAIFALRHHHIHNGYAQSLDMQQEVELGAHLACKTSKTPGDRRPRTLKPEAVATFTANSTHDYHIQRSKIQIIQHQMQYVHICGVEDCARPRTASARGRDATLHGDAAERMPFETTHGFSLCCTSNVLWGAASVSCFAATGLLPGFLGAA